MSAQTQTGLSGFFQRLIAPLRRREPAPNGEPPPATLQSPPATEIDQFRSAVPEWLARDDFANLIVLLRYATNGAWAFALYNDVATREMVMEATRPLLAPLPIFEWTWTPETPYPMAYLEHMTPAQHKARAIVFIFDFERAGDDVWKMLDYNREALAEHPHGLVFWISPAGRTNAQRRAPHFWAQRAGVFDFTTEKAHLPAEQRQQSHDAIREADISLSSRDDLERQLRLTQGMLDEAIVSLTTLQSIIADLHLKLAQLLSYADRLSEARTHAVAAMPMFKVIGNHLGEANTQKALGDIALRQSNLNEARDAYLAALPIYQAIGNRLGEANTQQALGDLALRESKLDEARDAYLAALPIHKAVEDRLGKTNTQQAAIGGLALGVGNLAKAHNAYHTQARRAYLAALSIFKAIGNRLGEANAQKALGDLALRNDELDEARNAYLAAQSIYKALGSRLGKANAQKALGDLKMRQSNLNAARDAYLAALPIYQAIGDRLGEADTQQALGDLALREGNLREAQERVEFALKVFKAIGDQMGEAGSYNLLGRITKDAAWFEQAIALHQKINIRYGVALDRYHFGLSLADKGDKRAGAEQMAQARDLWREIDMPQYAQMAEQQRQRMEAQAA